MEPRDVSYPGTILLHVDATDLDRRIFTVRETIPVDGGGPLTLFYPEWLPGYHSPQTPIELLGGLEITAGAERLSWRRDPVRVYAFHIEVPEGVRELEARFQFLSPTSSAQGRVVVTPDMLNLQWNTVVLYPAGYFARQIEVHATLRLPDGWQYGCALNAASTEDGIISFEPVSLDVLVDSPMFAGRYFRRIALDDTGAVQLNIVADRPDELAATDEQIEPHRQLVRQADELFGARHFDRFDFLLALSDEMGSIGVEHHRSCETGTAPDYFTNWETNFTGRDVMAHEYTHSWNGKFRRGADSWTPSFDRPIRNSLMWVYEGQTQYWGHVLAARSGLWTTATALEALAETAATYDIRAGRRWRPMSDTTRDPIIASRAPLPWISWQRSEDYYSEGQLMWLDIDTLIREMSHDTRSLDDFAKAFFGVGDGSYATFTYTFDDVVRTLDGVVQHEWSDYLIDKLQARRPGAPLDGLARGGYELVYRSTPSSYSSGVAASVGNLGLTFSLGVSISSSGVLQEVVWESPAFAAALTAGSEVVAVNGRAYSHDEINHAIMDAENGMPIELLVKNGKRHRQVSIPYHDGLRYPHLQRIDGSRARLDEIYAPRP
jgi:predicted metalloprotease with PDZ domain